MFRSIFLMSAVALTVAACSIPGEGLSYAMNNYRGVDPVSVEIANTDWKIYDKPSQNRMMITTGTKTSTESGLKTGVQFGTSGYPFTTEQEFRPYADIWLAQKGCKITDGRLVVPWQYEFDYACNR